MTATVHCCGVSVAVNGSTLVDGIDLDVADGEWVSVIGPNGAGKTTLLRAIAGLTTARGVVELAGRTVSAIGTRERSRMVALVPQIPVVPPSPPNRR